MNSFQIGPMSSFTISRKIDDPLSVEFNPPRGSDALFYALSQAYPEIKTHQLRLQKAVIEFHVREFDQESRLCDSSKDSMLPPMQRPVLGVPSHTQNLNPVKAPSEYQPMQESRVDDDLPQFHSMLGYFEKTLGPRKAHAKKPMNQKSREEYKIVKNIGACSLHRKQKKKVSYLLPFHEDEADHSV